MTQSPAVHWKSDPFIKSSHLIINSFNLIQDFGGKKPSSPQPPISFSL